MDSDIRFDPAALSQDQRDFLLRKLEAVTGCVDADGCEAFLGKSRTGKNFEVGSIRIDKAIGKPIFGKENLNLNPAALKYSLEHNYQLRYSDTVECSHICGFGLCLYSNHILMEPKEVNNERIQHHKTRVECKGHNSSDDEFFPPCIYKTVKPIFE